MKYQRHSKIIDLVTNESIETQEQLMNRLKEEGFNVTQATVSRDIKELRLFKLSDGDGTARYSVVELDDKVSGLERYQSIIRHNIRSIDSAGNIVVVNCYTGMAQAVCAALDAMKLKSIVGSIAGDDTIFLAVRTPQDAETIAEDIRAGL